MHTGYTYYLSRPDHAARPRARTAGPRFGLGLQLGEREIYRSDGRDGEHGALRLGGGDRAQQQRTGHAGPVHHGRVRTESLRAHPVLRAHPGRKPFGRILIAGDGTDFDSLSDCLLYPRLRGIAFLHFVHPTKGNLPTFDPQLLGYMMTNIELEY